MVWRSGAGDSRHVTLFLAVSFVAALGAAPGGAGASEFFVSPQGDDKAQGTSMQTAWRTVQRGVKDLEPGDILTLAPGVHDERVIVTCSGAAGNPITIRALRPGFSAIKASRWITGFRRVPGTRFVSAARAPHRVYNVMEADTHRMLLRAPALIDLDEFRNAYFFDDRTSTICVHCSDGLPASSHCVEVTVRPLYGIELRKAKYVHLDGLVIQGHFIDKIHGDGFGLCMRSTQNCVIRDCTFINNAGGACFVYGCANDVVRDCLFVGNADALYGELAQLYFSSRTKNAKAVNNIVLNAETHGIRFYNRATDCTAIGNIIKKARIGLYFKSTGGTRIAKNNVVVDCSYVNFGTGVNPGPMTVQSNTFHVPNWCSKNNVPKPDATNLIFDPRKTDPRFCDPDHLDYRLQADSPCRGKGRDRGDPGAYQFQSNVFFVSPKGNDKNDGLCAARAWRTLKHACLQAGPRVAQPISLPIG